MDAMRPTPLPKVDNYHTPLPAGSPFDMPLWEGTNTSGTVLQTWDPASDTAEGLNRSGGFDTSLLLGLDSPQSIIAANKSDTSGSPCSSRSTTPLSTIMEDCAPYFNGDVRQTVDNMWLDTYPETMTQCTRDMRGALLWSTMSAAGSVPMSILNRRNTSAYHALIQSDLGDENQPQYNAAQMAHNRDITETRNPGDKSRTVFPTNPDGEKKPKRVKYALGPRAAAMGKKIINDPARIVGMLEAGAKNRNWVIAICRWIVGRNDMGAPKSKWIDILSAKGVNSRAEASTIADQILANIRLWASQYNEFDLGTSKQKLDLNLLMRSTVHHRAATLTRRPPLSSHFPTAIRLQVSTSMVCARSVSTLPSQMKRTVKLHPMMPMPDSGPCLTQILTIT